MDSVLDDPHQERIQMAEAMNTSVLDFSYPELENVPECNSQSSNGVSSVFTKRIEKSQLLLDSWKAERIQLAAKCVKSKEELIRKGAPFGHDFFQPKTQRRASVCFNLDNMDIQEGPYYSLNNSRESSRSMHSSSWVNNNASTSQPSVVVNETVKNTIHGSNDDSDGDEEDDEDEDEDDEDDDDEEGEEDKTKGNKRIEKSKTDNNTNQSKKKTISPSTPTTPITHDENSENEEDDTHDDNDKAAHSPSHVRIPSFSVDSSPDSIIHFALENSSQWEKILFTRNYLRNPDVCSKSIVECNTTQPLNSSDKLISHNPSASPVISPIISSSTLEPPHSSTTSSSSSEAATTTTTTTISSTGPSSPVAEQMITLPTIPIIPPESSNTPTQKRSRISMENEEGLPSSNHHEEKSQKISHSKDDMSVSKGTSDIIPIISVDVDVEEGIQDEEEDDVDEEEEDMDENDEAVMDQSSSESKPQVSTRDENKNDMDDLLNHEHFITNQCLQQIRSHMYSGYSFYDIVQRMNEMQSELVKADANEMESCSPIPLTRSTAITSPLSKEGSSDSVEVKDTAADGDIEMSDKHSGAREKDVVTTDVEEADNDENMNDHHHVDGDSVSSHAHHDSLSSMNETAVSTDMRTLAEDSECLSQSADHNHVKSSSSSSSSLPSLSSSCTTQQEALSYEELDALKDLRFEDSFITKNRGDLYQFVFGLDSFGAFSLYNNGLLRSTIDKVKSYIQLQKYKSKISSPEAFARIKIQRGKYYIKKEPFVIGGLPRYFARSLGELCSSVGPTLENVGGLDLALLSLPIPFACATLCYSAEHAQWTARFTYYKHIRVTVNDSDVFSKSNVESGEEDGMVSQSIESDLILLGKHSVIQIGSVEITFAQAVE